MTLRALLVTALTLVASASGASDDLIISDAWVRETPPGKMMTAGYASIENLSKKSRHNYTCIRRGCGPHVYP